MFDTNGHVITLLQTVILLVTLLAGNAHQGLPVSLHNREADLAAGRSLDHPRIPIPGCACSSVPGNCRACK
jgi:hypothetical protein